MSDFALVLYLDSEQIVIELVDSLAGLMKLKFNEKALVSQKDYWQMKTDALEDACRVKSYIT